MLSAENIRTIIRAVGMTDKDFAYNNKEYFSDNKTVTLETRPLREVPTYGVFIYQANGAFHVYRKTRRIVRAINEWRLAELIYSTHTGFEWKGKPNFFRDDDQVAYTGVVLKGEI